MTNITFIGGGNMARNIVMGLIANGYPAQHLCVTNRSAEKLTFFREEAGIHVSLDNGEAAKTADVIILAIKPQQIKAVCEQLKAIIAVKKPLIISVAVGVTTAMLEKWLGKNLAIVRVMPNTPTSLRVGASGLYANSLTTPAQKELVDTVFRAVGLAVWVDEEQQIDLIAAISGSGPAYFFLIVEALQQAAQTLGLSAELSQALAAQTALGAARMVTETKQDVVQLRRSVTSPGGTTERAIQVFETADIRGLFEKALTAAVNRSKELTKTLDN